MQLNELKLAPKLGRSIYFQKLLEQLVNGTHLGPALKPSLHGKTTSQGSPVMLLLQWW